jgi:glycosyltransferase involved in cell wall biosynthesis
MRIVIDMQGAQTASRFRGIGRYTLSFAQALVRNRGDNEIILVLSGLFPETIEPIRAAFDGLLLQENICVWHAPGPVNESSVGNENRRELAEVIREAYLASLNPDIIHITSLFEGYVDDATTSIGVFDKLTPVSVTLYDLIPLQNPKEYLDNNKNYSDNYLRKVEHLRCASLFLSISNFSRNEIVDVLGVNSKTVINVSAAVSDNFINSDKNELDIVGVLFKFKIKKPFILYTGSTDERKNLPRLIEAFSLAQQSLSIDYSLVIAGGIPHEHQEIFEKIGNECGIKSDALIITGYLLDEEIIALIKSCALYVFPSWHEGFGLPVLEAMSCGAPVICSNTSSLPEVMDFDEATFDPFDVHSIKNKIVLALEDVVFNKKLHAHSAKQSKNFSWDDCAKKAFNAWKNFLDESVGINFSIKENSQNLYDNSRIIKYLNENKNADNLSLMKCLHQNFQNKNSSRQLLVDISELVRHDARTGIQRVVRGILREWLKNPPRGYTVEPIYATENQPYKYARKYVANFMGVSDAFFADEFINYSAGDVFMGLDLQPQVQTAHANFYSELRQSGVSVNFMIYDLLSIQMPEYFPLHADYSFSNWLNVVTENDGAVCISNAVANDLKKWMQINKINTTQRPFNISVNHLGADLRDTMPSLGMPENSSLQLGEMKDSPSFLMVGTLEPRKGHLQVLDAFESLWEAGSNANLVIAGKEGWMVDNLVFRLRTHLELNHRLFWLEGASDEYLEKIYENSSCLISASYGEGFGLPLIEAAQHKLPIIARDLAVFREVAGEHAYYFSSQKPLELAKNIEIWLALFYENQHPKSESMPWLTWKESAAHLLNLLNLTNIDESVHTEIKANH